MRLTVNAIDHQIALVVQLVGQAFGGHTADDGAAVLARLEHGQVALLVAHRPLHRADDVATLAQCPQSLFGVNVDRPDAGTFFSRQSHALKPLHTAHQQHTLLSQLRIAGWLIDMVQPVPCLTL